MFQALYDSPWLTTAAVAATTLVGLLLWVRRQTFLVAFVVLFTVEILADALRSGTWSPLHLLASPWEDAIGMVFVLLGDLRYFLLVERFAWRPHTGSREATAPKSWASALGLMAVVPLLVLGLQKAFPARFADARWTYLAYELLFVALAVGLRVLLPRRLAAAPAAIRTWLLEVTHFEIAQYALWALADVIILAGVDAGFALRLVPNFMYYSVFLFFVAFRAPAEVTA